jgi:hypothetical protein
MLRVRLVVRHNDLWLAYNTVPYPSGVEFTLANRPPTAVDDSDSVFEDGTVAILAAANDVDLNLDVDSMTIATPPVGGVAVPRTDGSGIIDYTPNPNFNGSDTFTYDICDTSAACSTTPATVTVTVTALNDEPSFTDGGNITVWEDSGNFSLDPWATSIDMGPPDEDSSQNVDDFLILSNSNPALFATLPDVNNSGKLTFKPADDANGVASIDVAMRDDGGVVNPGDDDTSVTHTFTITVDAVNDEPSFTKGADDVVPEDAGAQARVGWATSISAGPANESAQSVTFGVVANTNPTLFSAGPLVSSTGTLLFTPAPDVNGSATITIELQDSGGVANPGDDDTSPTQNFKITVTAVDDPPIAVNDSGFGTLEDEVTPLVIPAGLIRANDSDPDGEPFDIVDTGVVWLASDQGGSYRCDAAACRYLPPVSFTGNDRIWYQLTDGSAPLSNVGEIQITINKRSTDLQVVGTAPSPDPVVVLNKVDFAFDITNLGPDPAGGNTLEVTFSLPTSFGIITTTKGSCSSAGSVVTCVIGNMVPLDNNTVTIEAFPQSTGTLTSTTAAWGSGVDTNLLNNNDPQSVTVDP